MSKGFSRRSAGRHRVALVVNDGSNPFELNVAVEVFGITRPELDLPWYELLVCAPTPAVTMREGLYELRCAGTLADVARADTVIAPNRPDTDTPLDPRVLDALRAAAARGARMVSFCTGAFALAEAGLLDGRPATTHWMWTERFRRRHPAVDLRPGVLFVDDGDRLTAAGSAAALDLCLHLVRTDHGAAVARRVSERLVFPGHRDGGQQQFIATTTPNDPPALGRTLDWARERLAERLTVEELAGHAGMAVSTFHRRFLEETGTTPMRWLALQRLDRARDLLESSDLGVEGVAARVGLGTATNFRAHFRRHVGLTPTAYRRSRTPDPASSR
ncbi:MAG: GlxA family transcriptional regulator [Dermatophilaceae bacterium]